MELRPFRSTDLETLCEIDRACFPPGIAYAREQMVEYIAGRNSRTWIAQEGDEIIGFLIANCDRKEGHIVTVDVVREWRRHGVATALMDAAEDWARQHGAKRVSLETAENNLNAQQFYRARGYTRVRTIEGYYSNGAAAWIMVKEPGNESTVEGRRRRRRAFELRRLGRIK